MHLTHLSSRLKIFKEKRSGSAPTRKAFRLPRRSVRTQNQPARYSKDAKHLSAFAHSTRLLSPNCFKRSKQQSNCRQMQGFDTVISPESPLNMPAKVEEVYSFCHLRSSAKGREKDAKKGAEGLFATSQIASSFSQSEPEKSAQNTQGGWGGGGGGGGRSQPVFALLSNRGKSAPANFGSRCRRGQLPVL